MFGIKFLLLCVTRCYSHSAIEYLVFRYNAIAVIFFMIVCCYSYVVKAMDCQTVVVTKMCTMKVLRHILALTLIVLQL